jgi:hypothetical protein
VTNLEHNAVPDRTVVVSRELISYALSEDRKVLMLSRVLELRTCGWLNNELTGRGCGLSLLREGLGGRGLYVSLA